MLFLGMTSPKKEIFLAAHFGDDCGVPIMHGVGGSFDILAGVTQAGPGPLAAARARVAVPLLQEPRRLWRRYLVTNTPFLA